MRALVLAALFAVTGCGRIWFDPLFDGGDDASGGGDASGCGHTFCDGFDGTDPQAGWPDFVQSGASTITTENGVLVIDVSADDATAELRRTFTDVTTSFVLSFDLAYTSSDPSGAEIDLVHLRWETPPPPCLEVYETFVHDSTGPFALQESYNLCGGNTTTGVGTTVNTGPHHYEMSVTIGPVGTARVTASLDGVVKVDRMSIVDLLPGSLTLDLGAGVAYGIQQAFQFRYDNVTVDVQ